MVDFLFKMMNWMPDTNREFQKVTRYKKTGPENWKSPWMCVLELS